MLITTVVRTQNTDSLYRVFTSTNVDTIYYQSAIDLAWEWMYYDTDSAIVFALKGLNRAEKMNDNLRKLNAINTIGVCYIVFGDYEDALKNLNKAKILGEELLKNDTSKYIYNRRLLAVYTNTGNVFYYQANYEKAIENYIRALELSRKINFENGISICASNIGAAYKDLLNYDKALEYNYQALEIATKIGDRYAITQCLNNLGTVYFSIPNYDSAHYYFYKCVKINEDENFEYELINNYVNMGDVMREIKKFDSAYFYYDKALNISRKLKSKDGIINCTYMIGQYFEKTGNYKKAIDYYNECFQLSTETGTNRFVMLSQEKMSNVYEKLGNYRNAYISFKKSSIIKDSIFSNERDSRITEMETKYQSEEKARQIEYLNEKNQLLDENVRATKIVSVTLIIILVLIILSIYISYRSYKNRQFAARILIREKNKKEILRASVQAEYKERKRFAEDLHDSLGVVLSTLRLYLNEINAKSKKAERQEIINQSNELLDTAITNARNISNNIMPAVLKNNGLEAALNALCDKLRASSKIDIKLNINGLNNLTDEVVKLNVYRALAEMLNNSIKYSEADTISLNLSQRKNAMYITYTDNGTGFNYEEVMKSKDRGMGLSNIVSRINSVGGKCEIKSSPGKGFFAGIELNS